MPQVSPFSWFLFYVFLFSFIVFSSCWFYLYSIFFPFSNSFFFFDFNWLW